MVRDKNNPIQFAESVLDVIRRQGGFFGFELSELSRVSVTGQCPFEFGRRYADLGTVEAATDGPLGAQRFADVRARGWSPRSCFARYSSDLDSLDPLFQRGSYLLIEFRATENSGATIPSG